MSRLKFNHVFIVLMLISAACAFVVPLRMTNTVRAQFQNVVSPISRPIGSFAHFVHSKLARSPKFDSRDSTVIALENDQLKTTIANLRAQVKSLQQLTAERQLLGDVLPLCTPVPVVGGDAGLRESLSLQSAVGLQDGMFALYSGGVVGRLDRAGYSGGAQVRLITDPGFSVQGEFVRFVSDAQQGKSDFESIKAPSPLVQGAGNGMMVIRRLPLEELADVKPGDWVVVRDRDWPLVLNGYKLGVVESKEPMSGAPLFAEVKVRPVTNLMQLREVMVMTKAAGAAVRSAKTE
jgi:cell shape-determining protein MreC